jgi:dTDP-glucose 4,6-dehydratase
MHKELFSILIIFFLSIEAHNHWFFVHNFQKNSQNFIVYYDQSLFSQSNNDELPLFTRSALHLPALLEYAKHNKLPVIAVLPEDYGHYGPLHENASRTEGTCVALSWLSAYHRFTYLGNLDIRIIVCSKNDIDSSAFMQALEEIAGRVFKYYSCPEESISQRIVRIQELVNTDLTTTPVPHTMISPAIDIFSSLPEYQRPVSLAPLLPPLQPQQRRLCITGGAGFIGSHITREWLARGHQVIGIDNFLCSSRDNLQEFSTNENFCILQWDVSFPFTLEGPITDIIHCASIPSPALYYIMPRETLLSGLHGTKNTLDCALQKGARYLFTSTSEVYGDPMIHPQPEDYPGNVNSFGKRSAYDQSKRGAETLIMLYTKKYGIDTRIARIFNTYGPGMQLKDGRVVNNFINEILNNMPLSIYGTGLQTRSFCYISDTVSGILKLLDSPEITHAPIQDKVFNIGNNHEITIIHLSKLLKQLSEKYLARSLHTQHLPPRDSTDPQQRCPDLTRATALLQYQPHMSLQKGLEETFLFFLTNRSWKRSFNYFIETLESKQQANQVIT